MIDVYELMPGSIVKHKHAKNGEPITAYDIYKYKEAIENKEDSYYGSMSGVPITKAWLLKLGFKELPFGVFEIELDNDRFSTYRDKIFSLFYDTRKDTLILDITYVELLGKRDMESYTHELNHIKYVHQLQMSLLILGNVKTGRVYEQMASSRGN